MKTKHVLFLTILASSLAMAGGTEGGGGGDAVTLPNGDVVLADIFLDRNQPQPNDMPKRISLNPKLLLQLKIYGQFFKSRVTPIGMGTEISTLIEEAGTRDSKLVFYSVKDVPELNMYCASGGRKAYVLPSGAEVSQVACTSGNEVYIVESTFRKMSLHYQALLMIHERMTTLRDQFGGKNYGAIAGITSGLGKMIDIAYEQQNDKKRILTAAEITRVQHFYEALLEIEYRNKDIPTTAMDWSIHPYGGGQLWKGSNVADTAFVGVTATVFSADVQDGATLMNTTIPAKAWIGARTIVKNSRLSGTVRLEDEVSIIDSTLDGNLSEIGPKSRLVKVTALSSILKLGSENLITESQFLGANIKSGKRLTITKSDLKLSNVYQCTQYPHYVCPAQDALIIGDDQVMEGGLMDADYADYLPEPYQSAYSELNIGPVQTNCQETLKTYKKFKPDPTTSKGCFYFEASREDKHSFYNFDPNEDGRIILNIQSATDQDASGGFASKRTLMAVLRWFSVSLKFVQPGRIRPANSYSVYDGQLGFARDQRFSGEIQITGDAKDLIEAEIKRQVEAKGGRVETNPRNSNLRIWAGVVKKQP